MGDIHFTTYFTTLMTYVLLVAAVLPTCVDGLKAIVVDTDGGTDGLCALATILQDPVAKDQLTLVTVAGNQWTSLNAAVENVRNFLHLAGMSKIPVAAGSTISMGDISGSSSRFKSGDSTATTTKETFSHCEDGRHFPATPDAAAAMGIKVSAYDVDGLYGYAETLDDSPAARIDWPLSPPTELASSSFGVKFGATLPSTIALRSLVEDISTGTTLVNYIALAGLTNLGLFMQTLNESATLKPTESNKLIRDTAVTRIRPYIMANGNSLGLDAVATGYILGNFANGKAASSGLFTTIYAPPLLSRILFSFSTWSELSVLASASPAVKFIFKALLGRKAKIEEGDSSASTAFFNDHAVDASFVVMAVIDSDVRSAVGGVSFLQGSVYLTRPTYSSATGAVDGEVHFPSLDSSLVSTPTTTVKNYTLAGNTIVRSAVLSIVEKSVGPGVYVGDASNNLLDTFWRRWAATLKLTS